MAKIFIFDKEETASVLAGALKCAGHEVMTESRDPTQACRAIIDFQPQLVFADYLQVDGECLCHEMKKLKCTKDITFVMMSNRHPQIQLALLVDLFQDMGANHFLFKPFDPKKAVSRIQQWL